MLTVEPSRRLQMKDVQRHRWLHASQGGQAGHTPLRTPGVLSSCSTVSYQLSATLDAFHQATREGLRLQDVSAAPLAKRRKLKKNSFDNRSSSTDSNNSTSTNSSSGVTQSPVRQSPVRTFSNASSTSQGSTGFVPSRASPHCQRGGDLRVSPLVQTESVEPVVIEDLVGVEDQLEARISPISVLAEDSSLDIIRVPSGSCEDLPGVTMGIKRKADTSCEDDDELSDDDCVIIASPSAFTPTDRANNNRSRVKVPKWTGTIVIDD